MRKGMKTYVATFWRGNPQLKSGGYETTREINAMTHKAAERKALQYEKNCCYGSMSLMMVEEKRA